MNSKGLELFKTRNSLNLTEDIYKIDIPPIYKSFLLCFELGKEGLDIDFVDTGSDLIQFSSIVYKTEIGGDIYENAITNFFSFEELKQELIDSSREDEYYHKQGFIKIGNFDMLDRILLKVKGDSPDEIWKLNGDWGSPKPFVEKISENIFQFVRCISKELIQINLTVRSIDKKELRKGLEDDNWHI